jgi:hypothetical protein
MGRQGRKLIEVRLTGDTEQRCYFNKHRVILSARKTDLPQLP